MRAVVAFLRRRSGTEEDETASGASGETAATASTAATAATAATTASFATTATAATFLSVCVQGDFFFPSSFFFLLRGIGELCAGSCRGTFEGMRIAIISFVN